MDIVVHIPEELESSLRDAATKKGIPPERWASDVIEKQLKRNGNGNGETESEEARSERLKASFMARMARLEASPPPIRGAPLKGMGKAFAEGVAEKLRKQGVTGGQ